MKTLKEQYHLERINREIQINSADKKTIELSELVRKLSDDVDRLRHEKEFKEAEHKRKEKEELDTHKEKTNSL